MLTLKNIVKNYGTKENIVNALKDISLQFRENEFVSILGPSGCGKTTMLNIIGGLDKYSSGDLIINGVSTKQYKDRDWDTYRNHIVGFIFQSYNLIPHLSVLGNVEIALSLTGIKKSQRKKMALEALQSVGLKDQAKKKPNQLSGGQMQRVAIARALVNNPKIILADEPTGALDSETSIQVMEILKSISKDRLIIMVTHNENLAQKYSSRIISMLDGNITDDTNPYTPEKNITSTPKICTDNQDVKVSKNNKQKTKKHSSMSFLTSFNLSLRNLLSKKGRTIMTSFAGSMGIIGVALVLAISNGFSKYIDNIQSDALGNYPITISAISMDTNKFGTVQSQQTDDTVVNDNVVVPYNPLKQFIQYGHYNNFTTQFLNKIKDFEFNDAQLGESSKFNTIEYNYFAPIKLVYKTSNNEYALYKSNNSTSVLSGNSASTFYPLLNNTDFVLSQYDLIYGTFPKINSGDTYSKEMLLVVDEGNKLSISILKALGITPTTITEGDNAGEYENIDFSEICNKEFKVVFNNDYYTPNSNNFNEITKFDKLNTTDQSALLNVYNNSQVTLKISGVLRIKEDATSNLLSTGIAFMPSFNNYYLQNCQNSLIAQKQLATKSNYSFYDNYVLNVSEMGGILPTEGFSNVEDMNNFLFTNFGYTLTNDEAFELGLQQIGISKIPVNIAFYPKNFEGKDALVALINEYNNSQTNENLKIVYTDSTEFLTNTLGQLVDMISYVLIAFASISLVVSSVMIGVITYASVVERTKEIGVLRSLGARKKDISRVFNAETLLIGFSAGTLGIIVSYLICPIINVIIKSVADGAISSLAILNPLHALALIAISMTLTFISGLIPSKIASKKDPVVALRVE